MTATRGGIAALAFVASFAMASCAPLEGSGDRNEDRTVPKAGSDVPRAAFPSGAEGTLAWARACFSAGPGGLLLLPDLAYISASPTTQWWETAATERIDLRLGSGGIVTEMRARDPNDPRVVALFSMRGQRWVANGRKGDLTFRAAVECAHGRISTL